MAQEGDLETDMSSYYDCARDEIEDEFDVYTSVNFHLTDARTEEDIIFVCFEAHLDTDIGMDKVFFSEPQVSLTVDMDYRRLKRCGVDSDSLRKAICTIVQEELWVRPDLALELDVELRKEMVGLGEKRKRLKKRNNGLCQDFLEDLLSDDDDDEVEIISSTVNVLRNNVRSDDEVVQPPPGEKGKKKSKDKNRAKKVMMGGLLRRRS